jgi:hypothetical protein
MIKNGAANMNTKTRIEKSLNKMLRIALSVDDPVERAAAEKFKEAIDRAGTEFRRHSCHKEVAA